MQKRTNPFTGLPASAMPAVPVALPGGATAGTAAAAAAGPAPAAAGVELAVAQRLHEALSEKLALRQALTERDDRINELQQVLRQLKKEMTARDSRISELEYSMQQLQNQYQAATGELNRLRPQSQHVQTLEDRLSRESSQYKTLKARFEELERGFKAKSEDNMRLASELETARHNIDLLGRQVNEARRAAAQGGSARSTAPDSSAERARASSSGSGSETELLALRQRIQQLVAENQRLKEAASSSSLSSQLKQPVSAAEAAVSRTGVAPAPGGLSEEELQQELTKQRRLTEETMGRNISLQSMLQQAIQQRDEYKDKLQREEVITAQLASENESIAEYVTLYQQQRLALSRHAKEKDDYIDQLKLTVTALEKRLQAFQAATISRPPLQSPPPLATATTAASRLNYTGRSTRISSSSSTSSGASSTMGPQPGVPAEPANHAPPRSRPAPARSNGIRAISAESARHMEDVILPRPLLPTIVPNWVRTGPGESTPVFAL